MFILDPFSAWLTGSHWPCIIIAVLVFLESSPVIGLFIPGVLLLPAIGALSGSNLLEFEKIYLCCLMGALAADSLGYALGRLGYGEWHHRFTLRGHNRARQQARNFLHHYGGITIFVGRIMWLIHPLVPTLVGALGTPAWRFYLLDTLAVIIWLALELGIGHGLLVYTRQFTGSFDDWLILATGLIVLLIGGGYWWHSRYRDGPTS
ncbi:MAG TPA: DedA family protein [Gammaproteobacteria bacterium]|nr:DedA family protein [Gammaproteobacteria bacterium]